MNLTKVILTEHQKSALSKGLKYCPVPCKKFYKTTKDLFEEFSNTVKKEYFFNSKRKPGEPPAPRLPFILKSDWEPPEHKIDEDLLSELEYLESTIDNVNMKALERNLSKKENFAIADLSNNKHNLIIRKADKGSAVVLMSREDYIWEVLRQLEDPEYYKPLDHPIFNDTISLLDEVLDELENTPGEVGGRNQNGWCGINTKQREYLSPWTHREARERLFYTLPKIHKDPAKWSVPFKIPPGRPIVSDCGSESYEIAEFIDYFLQPLACIHKGYIKNTPHFIEIVSKCKVKTDTLIGTADVDGMYTNIGHVFMMEAVKNILGKNPPTADNPRIPDELLLKLLEISLTRNDFYFNQRYSLQIKGAAMGKRFAPSCANIFMAEWEQQVLSKVTYKPDNWDRYLDDVYFLWQHGEERLKEFFKILNNDHPCVKLKHETSLKTIDFLDVTVYKGDRVESEGKLETKLYRKPTDTMELLHTESYHPRHTFKGIVKSQIIRFRRICSNDMDFNDACQQLFTALIPRGYSFTELRKIKKETLAQLDDPKPRTKFTTTQFNEYLQPPQDSFKVSRCDRPGCETCLVIKIGDSFESTQTKIVYQVHYNMDCKSQEIIYLITCKKCGIQYVGQTSMPLKQRMWKYRNRITTTNPPRLTEVEAHFRAENDHDGLSDFEIMPICRRGNPSGEKVEGEYRRQQMEDFFIRTLDTLTPKGLNGTISMNARVLPLKIMFTEDIHQWGKATTRYWYRRIYPTFYRTLPGRALVAVKRQKNLKDLLCKSRLDEPYTANQIAAAEAEEANVPEEESPQKNV